MILVHVKTNLVLLPSVTIQEATLKGELTNIVQQIWCLSTKND